MTGVTIGDLRHRIRLQARILAGDGGGGFAESWSDLAEIWAAIRPSAGAEVTLGEQRRHRVTHEVIIRYRLGVQPGQRLIYDGRALYVLGIVNPAERDTFLSLHCEERTSP